jgi:hypothetical protein
VEVDLDELDAHRLEGVEHLNDARPVRGAQETDRLVAVGGRETGGEPTGADPVVPISIKLRLVGGEIL